MKADVTTLDASKAGTVDLADAIFGLKPRPDLIHRMVRYQLLKRMAGTHHAQDRSEVNVTGKKMYKQKGSGQARHGDKSVPQWRGGGKAFGPTPLIIDAAELEATFVRAARNLPNIDVLPVQGINVYDILRRRTLVLTKAAVAALEQRFADAKVDAKTNGKAEGK